MKNKNYSLKMPRLTRWLCSFLFIIGMWATNSVGQTTLYTQDFGTGTTFPTGWSATGTSTWATVNSQNSTGYTGASGGSNVQLINTATGAKALIYNNTTIPLVTTGYTNITVIWGARRLSGVPSPVLEWSVDGSSWNSVAYTDVTANATWALANGGTVISLPSGAGNIANLRLRWTLTWASSGGTISYRFDDLTVAGTAIPSITSLGSTSGCTGTNIVINGSGFTGATAANVKIGGTAVSSIVSNTGTVLTAVIGNGTTGNVTVATAGGTATSAASFTVNTLPTISVQPTATQTICSGNPVSFSVTGTGSPAPTYQWRKGGVNISGATSSSYSISSVIPGDAATYTVVLTNTCGSLTSGNAVLNVNTPPSISSQPGALTKCAGSSATFSVTASGSSPTYQWRKGGSNISGATSSSYTISSVAAGDAANYDVLVSVAGCTSLPSTTAALSVNARPLATITSGNTALCNGLSTNITGTVTASGAWTLVLNNGGGTATGTGNGSFSKNVSPSSTTTYAISTLSDANCSSIAGDLTGSTAVTVNALPSSVSATPSLSEFCATTNTVAIAGNATTNSISTINTDNFNGTPTYAGSGSTTGSRSQIFTKETSGTNVNSVGTFTSPNGGGIMIALAAAPGVFGTSTSSANTELTSPVINTNNFSTLTLTYNHSYKQGNSGSPSGKVEVSTNNGTSWTTIKTFTTDQGGATSFVADNITLSNTYLNQPNFKLRFNFVSSNSSVFFTANASWWAIDDVLLNGKPVPLYSWSANTGAGINGLPANAGTPLASNKNITVAPSATTNYTMTATDAVTGCTSAATPFTITVHALPTATITSVNTSICPGGSTNITGTVTAGASDNWDLFLSDDNINPAASGTGSGSFSVSKSPSSTTTYSIALIQTDNCEAAPAGMTGSTAVTINPLPSATISGTEYICSGNAANVSLNFTAGNQPWNYTISDGVNSVSGSSSAASTVVTIPSSALSVGTHNFTVTTITDAYCTGNATGTATAVVSGVIPGPSIISVSVPSTACNASVNQITASVVASVPADARYSWNTGSNSSVVKFSNNIGGPFVAGPFETATPVVYAQFGALISASGYNVCVQAKNGCGSSNNKCSWIQGSTNTPASISGPAVVCANGTGTYNCGSSLNASVYTWSFPGATFTGQGTQTVDVTFPANTNGQLCVTAGLACGGTSVPRCITISNTPANPGLITGSSRVCPGGLVTYSIAPIPGVSNTGYNWFVPPGASISGPANGNSVNVLFPDPYTSAGYTVGVNANGPCVGSVTATRSMTVNSNTPGTPANISGPTVAICNQHVVYTASLPSGVYTGFTWTMPSGNGLNNTNMSGQSIQFDVAPPFTSGQLQVSAVYNYNGCVTSSPPRSITINAAPVKPVNVTPTIVCNEFPVTFFASPAPPSGTSYNWFFSNGSITGTNPSLTDNIDGVWKTGDGNVQVTARNSCATSSTLVQPVTAFSCRVQGSGPDMQNNGFSVYPNPAHEKLTVNIDATDENNFTVKLIDVAGRIVLSENVKAIAGSNSHTIDLTQMPKGIYLMDVKSPSDHWKTKVVIE